MSKIEYAVTGQIATITLNRPEKLNALDVEMLDALVTHLDEIAAADDVRVVLLRGAGKKAFCVGADIIAWTALQPLDMWRQWIARGHRVFDRVAKLRQPVIAVLEGYTLGGGLELAMAADIRLAGDWVQFGQPEVKLATIPGWGGTSRLPALIGAARAKQMIFSGERINAQTALAWGLVNEIHAAEALYPRVDELAGQIAANAPVAVQLAKQVIDAGLTGPALEGIAGALAANSEDAKEGLAAFQARRTPQFKGK